MRTCGHTGCSRPHKAQGFCAAHYAAERKSGRLKRVFEPDHAIRFWLQVEKTGSCWNWTGYCGRSGYGQFAYDWKTRVAHRVAYELAVGPVPEGMQLDHLCRNRKCVRPDHLEPVTPRENLVRGTSFVAVNAAKSMCDNGHAFTPENTYTWRGHRSCRLCARERTARWRSRQAAT